MRNFAAKIKNQLFMAQKQKLKSERGSGNEVFMDLFLTLDPQAFASVAKRLSLLFDADKKSFNLLLDKFDELKGSPMEGSVDEHRTKKFISKTTVNDLLPMEGSVDEHRTKKFISKTTVNDLLIDMLWHYWNGQQQYAGGYLKRMLPKQKESEPSVAFRQRMHEMNDVLGILFVHVLRECDYFKR